MQPDRSTDPSESEDVMPSPTDQDVELVRLYITDLDPESPVLTDTQIMGLLGQHRGSVPRSAAAALRIIAASELLRSKVIRTQDLSTDGRAVSQELRALAAEYERQADEEDMEDQGGSLGFVPYEPTRVSREAEEARH